MEEIRTKGGKKAAIVGIGANTLLTVLNLLVGLISGSYALISEGAHTLSDIATTIIAYTGFKIGQKPPDKEYPIGYGRAEAIAGLVITMFLVVIGYEITMGAIKKLQTPTLLTAPDSLAALMAIIGIIVNIIISTYIISLGKKINSPAIMADGQHQRADIYSSVAILIGVIIAKVGYPIFDPIIGLFIGLMIFKTAYRVGKENVENIMGKIPSQELIDEIECHANEIPKVKGAHNIRVDYLGSYAIVSLHIELDGTLTLYESHVITHDVEDNLVEKIELIKAVNVHACPHHCNNNNE